MKPKRRSLFRILGPALLLAVGLVLATPGASGAYPEITHVDGYLSAGGGGCLMLRQHDGRVLALRGATRGMADGDHVRLEGRPAPDPGCGAPGFDVNVVQTVWADDYHRSTLYDHLNGESFQHFAERTGRFDERRDYDRGRDNESPDRPDRYGRYVYQGPHRFVTLVGRLHESSGACPTLSTSYTTLALDGPLGDYQAGDMVRVTGVLYDGDPNAPCGGATVVVRGIRGYGR
ncbi:MAG TPA: hypothetical protein VMW75_06535 [Thermoanaerobaculia bacterium]|nr:hypothetical protein [Thermoanaerobaculia bacterium]